MTVRNCLMAAQALASQQFPEIQTRWIELSFRLGFLIPHSLLMVEIQRCGRVDLLLRSMEAETASMIARGDDMGFGLDVQHSLSETWVGKAYAILFALSDRRITRDRAPFQHLFSELRMLRVTLEKFEIASDRNIPAGGLEFATVGDGPRSSLIYDPADRARSHILPSSIDRESGALLWAAFDVSTHQTRWVNRQTLANQMLELSMPSAA